MTMQKVQRYEDTAASWAARNPKLPKGWEAVESDTGLVKMGDGSTAYNALPYSGEGTGSTFNLMQYGWGTTASDTDAFQDALDAAKAAHGGRVVLPAGTTNLLDSITVDFNNKFGDLHITGTGGNTVVLVGGGTANQAAAPAAMYFGNIPNLLIENITFIGTAGNDVLDFARAVIFAAGGQRATVRNCRFINLAHVAPTDATYATNKGHGIIVGFQNDLVVDSCLFGGNSTWQCPNIDAYEYYSLTVRDCHIIDYAGYDTSPALTKVGGTYTNYHWIRAILPLDRTTSGWHKSKVKIENCSIDEAVYSGVFIDGANFVEINGLGANVGELEAIHLKSVERATLKDCHIMEANTGTTQSCKFEDCGSVEIDGLSHTSGVSTIETTGTTERLKLRNGQSVVITNTAGSLIDADQAMPTTASAAALAPKGKVTHVTGTTNITSITATNFRPGDEITLIFDGVLTLTDGNNIAAAGDFVTTAGDSWKAVYDGTNFVELSRSIN